MIRVTRYTEDGELFHTCLTESAQIVMSSTNKVYVNMPARWWAMPPMGKIELTYWMG